MVIKSVKRVLEMANFEADANTGARVKDYPKTAIKWKKRN